MPHDVMETLQRLADNCSTLTTESKYKESVSEPSEPGMSEIIFDRII